MATRGIVIVLCHLKAQDDGLRASHAGCRLHPVNEMVCHPHGVAVDLAARAGAETPASIIPRHRTASAQFYKTGKFVGLR